MGNDYPVSQSAGEMILLTMEGEMSDLIKVNLGGETVWAERLGPTLAKIKNVPLNEVYSLDDEVEIDRDEEDFCWVPVRIIKKAAHTVQGKYDGSGSEGELKTRFRAIAQHFQDNNIKTEGMVAGYIALAVPVDMQHDEFDEIVANCPYKVEFQEAPAE